MGRGDSAQPARKEERESRVGHNTIFDRDELDLIVSLAGCTLNEKPGKNWVEKEGGLPDYICRIARAIKKTGKSTEQAIAIAVSRVKKWAAGGDDVDADTRAKAAKALAQWEKLKAKAKSDNKVKASNTDGDIICLAKNDFNVDLVRREFERQSRKARDEWRASNPNAHYDAGPPYMYVKEQWTSFLIVADDGYRRSGKMFKVPYTVDAKQQVKFSDPVEVTTKYVVVADGDMAGDDISDADLKAMVAATGPCPKPSATQTLLNLTVPRRTALEQVLEQANRD